MLPPKALASARLAALLTAVTAVAATPAAPRPTVPPAAVRAPAGGEAFFETKVRPVLVKRCGSCHGAEKPGGGLRLTSRAALLTGGGRGSALRPGSPEESLLLRAVTYADPALKMPPGGRLPEAEIGALRAWIRAGAPWPAEGKGGGDGPLWSAQPVHMPAIPGVGRPEWVRNPIDAFILHGLERHGMRPAPPASRRELIRRATFDLTGLPPTPEEVDAFLADARPDAYERLVDRLLASPRYGERWARYWLDLVRYADSNGYERDAEKPYSWKYRDYVIASLNRDKPYHRFVVEQLAGDELPDRSEETVTATGFLRLGTWDDEPNDPVDYQYERLDDLVHVTSTAFLGLTVRCARCHDHKFDPIPQTDYYALGAAFWGGYVQPGDGKLLGGPPPERLGYPVLGFTDRGPEAPPLRLLASGDPKRPGPVVPPGYLSLVPQLRHVPSPPPPGATTTHRRLQLAGWIVDPRNPLTPRVLVNRIWQGHFGEGLVRTPNNFGRKGSPPTHPELLDYLAATFIAPEPALPGARAAAPPGPAWSLKRLHRLIMLSSTYRMASVHPLEAEYSRRDPANEGWWRFNRRRLDADALRDALLSVSGQLNPQMGGRGFTPAVNRAALEGLSRKGAEWAVSPPEEQHRRSIYMFLKRALIMPFMTAFDFGDTTQPIEQRESAVVPTQALALMNNAFSREQSQALARRVRTEAGASPGRQVERLWRLALGRSPDAAERAAALRHLARIAAQPAREEAGARAAAPRAPDSVPELGLWLRADRGVRTDEQGRVTAWGDQSGVGDDAAAPEPAARPLLVRSAIHGQPALRFDGSGRYLTLRGQPITSPAFTIIALATDTAGTGSHRELFSNWRREDNIFSAIFLGTTGAGVVRFTDAFAPAGTLLQPERPHLLTAVTGPGGAAVYQDRTLLADRPGPLTDRNLKGPYVVGQQGNIHGEYWRGDIAELLVYNRALSRGELEAVWGELSRRYGIAAPPPPSAPAERALASLCHAVLNTNEFMYVD